MFKRNKIYTVVAASALISISAMSIAQQDVTSTATVTVSNSFDLAEVAAIDFGQLGVFQDLGTGSITGGNEATYTVQSDGSANAIADVTPTGDAQSRIVEITAGTPGEYSIANATSFTDLTVDLTGAVNFALEDPTLDPALNSTFSATIAEADVTIVGGPNDGQTLNTGTTELRTDTNGEVSFRVGATLTPNNTAAAILDGDYVGTYTITVSY